MAYIPDLMQVQLGKETTWGTVVTATAKMGLLDECTLKAEIENEALEDIRGSLAPSFVSVMNYHKGSGSLSGTLSYEDAPFLFDSLLGEATPSGVNPYTYAYTGALATVPSRRKLSLIKGQSGLVHTLAGGLVTEINITGEKYKPIMYKAQLIGKKVVTGSLAALSDRTLNPILSSHGSLYIDAVGGTIGSTAITTTFFAFDLTVKLPAETFGGIGSIYPSNYREQKAEVSLKMTLEADATSLGYFDALIAAKTAKQVRISFSDSPRTARLDVAGFFKAAPELHQDTDGVVSFEFEIQGEYNSTLTNYFGAQFVNAVSALP